MRLAQHLDSVAPASPVEVIEPELPLPVQVGRDQAPERRTVAGVPGALDVVEQPGRRRADHVGRESAVLISRLSGRELDPTLALGYAPALGIPRGLLPAPPRHQPRQDEKHDDRDDDQQQQAATAPSEGDEDEVTATAAAKPSAAEAAASAATKPATTAEPGAAAAAARPGRRRPCQQRHDRRQQDGEPSHAPTPASGPTPGCACRTCWSAW